MSFSNFNPFGDYFAEEAANTDAKSMKAKGLKSCSEEEFQKKVTETKAKSSSHEEGGKDIVEYHADGKLVAMLVNPEGDGNAQYFVKK